MFGKRIQSLRIGMKMTQSDLAKKLCITRSALSQYELGSREPSYEILISISDFFNVTTDYLLKGENSVHSLEKTLIKDELNELKLKIRNIEKYIESR